MNNQSIEAKVLNILEENNLVAEIKKAIELDEEVKIAGIIFESKKYSKLNRLSGNRNIDVNNVKKIESSVVENGYKKSQPIIVDSDLSIIDGQHRLQVCKNMDIPVYFTVEGASDDSLKLTQDLNRNQKNWGLSDYIQSFADRGYKDYQNFIEFISREKINISLGIWFLYKSRNGETQSKIKEGRLKCAELEIYKIKSTLDKIRELKNAIPSNLKQEKELIKAMESDKIAVPLMVIMEESNYSQERMLKQISALYRSIDKRSMAVAGDSLVEMYNHKLGKNSPNRLRAYNEISQSLR